MKLKEAINLRSLFMRKSRFKDVLIYSFWVDTVEVRNWKALGNSTGKEIKRRLAKFTTPQYNTVYFIRNKRGYQTLNFQQSYDIVLTDKAGTILSTNIDVRPGIISKYNPEVYSVYFLPVGSILSLGLKIKGYIDVKRKWV